MKHLKYKVLILT